MYVEKRINNNVLLASEDGQQMVLVGKGIGFQAYPGNKIDKSRIEKTFYPTNNMTFTQMAALMTGCGPNELRAVFKIVNMAKETFKELNDNMFFSLLDHLSFALKRREIQMDIVNPLEWEIKKFYSREYQMGIKALEIIKADLGTQLPDSEAAFFALHIVNAQIDSVTGEEIFGITEMTNSILKLVKYFYQCEFDEDSVFFNRFITHVRYYLMRRLKGEEVAPTEREIIESVRKADSQAYECANKIAQYIYERQRWETSETEKMYLMLHIINLVKKVNK
ncbi:PRD domain-containing protein [Lacrimispora sp.]|uniref:PRD domain-containing protein n=1 Tax=Lacrimispora sp. TaxID=2719234 RepID=UPI0028AD3BC7|nr:PRD domain-containing protein [Lacrimispora sp.]